MIDLHMHTHYSDGTDTVEELLLKAEKEKIEIISITDHDSVDAYKDLENKNIRSLYSGKIITGTELKTHYNGIPIEVLGYGINYKKLKIHKMDIYNIQVKALEEYKKIGKSLGMIFDKNITVSKNDTSRKFGSFVFASEILKYEENKKILFSIGAECDPSTFYRVHTSNKNSIFYYDESENYISLEETINRIHEAGGIAILAHPLLYPYENENKLEEIERILIKYDLDGLECEYPLFDEGERNSLKELAKKYNKYMSGGSDYHAKNKPNTKMGTGIQGNINISQNLIDDWIEKVKII